MRRLRRFLVCFFLFSCVLFSSCSGARISPDAAIGALLAAHSLPAGVVYGADLEGEAMFFRLFGSTEKEMDGIRSFGLYLSAREAVCEVAVFDCYTKSEARELAELCAERGDFLARRENTVSSKVLIKGKYLLWAACEDPDILVATLSRAVN